MESTEEISPRPLPVWLSIPVILLCLSGGGWIIHWYVMTDSLTDETHLLGEVPIAQPPQQQAGARRGNGPSGPNGGGWGNGWIRELPNGTAIIRGNVATARALLGEGRHTLRLTYNDYKNAFASDEMRTLEKSRLLVEGGDKAIITAMKLTDDQVQKLRNLAQAPEVAATPQQRDAILAAFTAYRAAPVDQKQAATNKLRQLVDEVATQAMPATKAQITDRAKKLNDIVTPEQWKINTDMGGGK